MVNLQRKIEFLSSSAGWAGAPKDATVKALETHMSWVFLCGERVLKLKKPVHTDFVDFRTLAAREHNCREEVRLNQRLAPDTYRGTVALVQRQDGTLGLADEGEVIDWLVEMRRLPASLMMDELLREHRLKSGHIDRLMERLTDFYRSAERPDVDAQRHIAGLKRQQDINRQVLLRRELGVDQAVARQALDAVDEGLHLLAPLIMQRVAERRLVEGHGDLRPEHVCFRKPLVIFDCLEFDRELRIVDPFDEIAFLGMECAVLGAAALRETMFRRLQDRLDDHVSRSLWVFYGAFRASMRARMALSHLLDDSARDRPRHWIDRTGQYLAVTVATLTGADRG
ncbi:MAG: hypothetical protein KJ947_21655 [Alphaproteobacteria bacterium]|jgi:uncharacterized protein|nr:hypothetical protein [Alphaproteobacteria bacterium]MBU1552153.1 hypothetical protein [Alphaproteobacteria bacterium]MBU2336937.1 hypothetical protein [Alphaproteobacteria bacterium]MBU2389694.1 hypothetical protein [Alphaproteobacteria bacterium]